MDFGLTNIIHESAAIINNYDLIYNDESFLMLKNDLERFTSDESMYYDDHYQKDKNNWKEKSILQWNHADVVEWIFAYIYNHRVDFYRFQIENYKHVSDGTDLCNMTLENFLACDLEFGELVFKGVQDYLKHSNIFNILPKFESIKTVCENEYETLKFVDNARQYLETEKNEQIEEELNNRPGAVDDFDSNLPTVLPSSDDDDESVSNDDSENISERPFPKLGTLSSGEARRGRGRPRGTTTNLKKKTTAANSMGRLWEFIRNLLLNPNYCPSLIKWENYEEGVFRFVRTEKVAELWGSRKCNGKMTYEKLSRALRYYYRTNVFQPVLGRRLVYKFGPAAHGWQTANPNFEN